ncbi:dipeptide ABC transporter ATP-binding protein [Natronobacterium gregoryi]|uniref:Nickel import system ATP-binding protein NikD n=2 Tax=Natronobacterium gregoryi TaxID=44930 RepID=L0AKL1_NATGS|nr:ABC transporter ATP-binding protein [Natronobacterium gregoryi]AFZ74438.1 oligopeptide/dipeptide ABC transporter, ATP-binding protein [Natronobacterium gregoryi SP2]ELY72101.1 oligopeptide/dipeptide ABC transporter ATPase [Natronobacterium gregoryi SP2]PLK19768.1 ABC transporter ATP-binding protein [Natronobacterium gregoryi SP2]SFJ40977.1 peptide/nickel transport system ATP-binding protein [Natronobacterium gregoryi]
MRLNVSDLHVRFRTRSGPVHAVNGASFTVDAGEIVGLVGESGCGKSTTARSITRLEGPGEIVRGSLEFGGTDLTVADEHTLRRLRGRELAMVFQNPETTLNPTYTVGEQIAEALRVHRDPDDQPFFRELFAGVTSRIGSNRTRNRVLELMDEVGIPSPDARIDDYPHQFSGGLCQRAMLAIALARRPSLLVADEPTTALDTTTQAAILERLSTLNDEYGMGILLISHDLGIVSQLCDRTIVMYDGVVVESGPTEQLLSNPAHPYTKALLDCRPSRSEPGETLPTVGGSPPGDSPPAGCRFVERCPFARDSCRDDGQNAVSLPSGRVVRCDVPAARDADLESVGTATEYDCPEPTVEDDPSTTANGMATDSSTGPDTPRRRPSTSATDDETDRVEPVLELESVTKSFRTADGVLDRVLGTDEQLPAVSDVSLELRRGETLGLVGESGCGKSTLARVIAGLESPTDGTVSLHGEPVGDVDSRRTDQLSEVGVVFQNPGTSFDPRLTVGESLAEPLLEAGWEATRRKRRIEELLSLVELPLEYADRYPGQLSKGQLQRVGIARALALEPAILLLDEPTGALDVSVQATVLNVLARLQADLDLTYLFVSHDLEVVRHVADRVATMYLGQLLEIGPASRILSQPAHPYTAALLAAIPDSAPAAGTEELAGEPPSPTDPPTGCTFHPRCPLATEECKRHTPAREPVGNGYSRCHLADKLADGCSEND